MLGSPSTFDELQIGPLSFAWKVAIKWKIMDQIAIGWIVRDYLDIFPS